MSLRIRKFPRKKPRKKFSTRRNEKNIFSKAFHCSGVKKVGCGSCIYHWWKIVTIVASLHNEIGHVVVMAIITFVRYSFWWSRGYSDTKNYARECENANTTEDSQSSIRALGVTELIETFWLDFTRMLKPSKARKY